jgi:hypothetical protein
MRKQEGPPAWRANMRIAPSGRRRTGGYAFLLLHHEVDHDRARVALPVLDGDRLPVAGAELREQGQRWNEPDSEEVFAPEADEALRGRHARWRALMREATGI